MKKGISLVALVITIIVLIILTGAVVLMGINVPENAQLAVFKSNVGTVQDAVTMKMVSNTIQYANIGEINKYKWVGVIKDYNVEDGFVSTHTVNGKNVAVLDGASLSTKLSIGESEVEKYGVDENGIVYSIEGVIINGVTYYNKDMTTGTPSGGGTVGSGTLASVIDIGDFIAYDCGNWTETVDIPIEEGSIGGYTEGISKATSIEVEGRQSEYNGWRVLSINRNETPDDYTDDIITLIHAGTPAVLYGYVSDWTVYGQPESIIFAQNNFVNSTYADSAEIFHHDLYEAYNNSALEGLTVLQNVTTIGTSYWTFRMSWRGDQTYIRYDGAVRR